MIDLTNNNYSKWVCVGTQTHKMITTKISESKLVKKCVQKIFKFEADRMYSNNEESIFIDRIAFQSL